jgi:hypothetical protein
MLNGTSGDINIGIIDSVRKKGPESFTLLEMIEFLIVHRCMRHREQLLGRLIGTMTLSL